MRLLTFVIIMKRQIWSIWDKIQGYERVAFLNVKLRVAVFLSLKTAKYLGVQLTWLGGVNFFYIPANMLIVT